MPHLFDILDQDDYERARDAGHIRVQAHPTLPYLVHNYTDSCTWEQAWTPATLACRGLITHADTGQVLARPMGKFFNVDQPGAPMFHPDEPVIIMDKVDGSLGVLYPLPDSGYAIATRGSFTSEQAVWATEIWRTRYAPAFTPQQGITYLFEIIAPWNRIVVDYADTEDLILLGAVNIDTGRSLPIEEASAGWPGPVVEVFPFTSLRDALGNLERPNAEGFVLWHPERDERIKAKQEDYKQLHRWLTGTTEKHVWEVLSLGQNPDEVFAAAPDEFHGWLKGVVAELRAKFAVREAKARAAHAEILASLPDGWGRKDYAVVAAKHPSKSLLFLLLDNKDLAEPIWRELKPSGASTVRTISGDAD